MTPNPPVMASPEQTALFLQQAADVFEGIGWHIVKVAAAGRLSTVQVGHLRLALNLSIGARDLFVAEIERQGGARPTPRQRES